MVSVSKQFRLQAAQHPDRLLFRFLDINGTPTASHTFAQFDRRVADIARHLQRVAPSPPGTRVLLVYPPGLEMIAALFACVRLGLIPVPVYPPTRHNLVTSMQRMAFVAEDCGARILLTERSCSWLLSWALAKRQLQQLTLKKGVIGRLQRVLSDEAECNDSTNIQEAHSDVLFLQYTSGSTHDPKGVKVTHAGILANCAAAVDHDPVCVTWLPQYHDLGLIGYYIFIALRGGTTYGFSPLDFIQRPALWLETISRTGANSSAAPNFAFAYCLRPDKVPDSVLDGLDLSRLSFLATAAEPVHAETFTRFQQRFARCGLKPRSFFSSYGLAEFTLVVSQYGRTIQDFDAQQLSLGRVQPVNAQTPTQETKKLVSCGPPIPGTAVKIVEPGHTPRECGIEEVGEIWIDGPAKGLGYWGRPTLSASIFDAKLPDYEGQRWLRTGDLGFLHQGELYICGRLKDLIIIRGRNYYPQDFEVVVESDATIRPGCTAAFSIEQEGQELLVIVTELRNPRKRPDVRQLNQRLITELGVGATTWVFIRPRTIPKTSSGKIRRHRVRSDLLDGNLAVIERIESCALGHTASSTPDHPLSTLFQAHRLTGTEDGTLAECGLDSLQLACFAHDLQQALEALGAEDVDAAVDLRLLQKVRVVDLYDLLRHALDVGPAASRRFREVLVGLQREHQAIERRMMLEDADLRADSWTRPTGPDATTGGGTLLTGGTGFLGPFLVQSLLQQSTEPLYVLVRGENASAARARLLRTLKQARRSISPDDLARISVICGDLSKPGLGLDPADWHTLATNTHTIFHNGALVNYLFNYDAMREANVLGTRELLRLAFSERTKVFNHISTTFVFGWSKQDILQETDNNDDLDLLDFGYSQSKWVSEQLVQQAMDMGLPGRIFRPALVSPTGDCRGAEADISIRLLAFMLKHGIGTSAANQVSFTPVDQVASNIVAISSTPGGIGQTFHVTRDDYANLANVTDILGRITEQPMELLDLHSFVDAVIERCTKDDPLFPLLNFFVRSTNNISAMSFKRYHNSQYQAARAQAGCAADPSLETVVTGIYQFMKQRGLVDKAPPVGP